MDLAAFKVAVDAWLDEHAAELAPNSPARARSTSRWRNWRKCVG